MSFLIVLAILLASDSRADELSKTAETILIFQRSNGGWPKNYNRANTLSEAARQKQLAAKNQNDTTIDNGATYREIELLAKAYQKHKRADYKTAAIEGIHFLLKGQYKNGGWPQRFPNPSGYHQHITFNDNAMTGVLSLFKDIEKNNKLYSFVPEKTRERCLAAISKGVECILRCQVVQDEKRTVWCAQHDSVTFQPAQARSYELPSLSGNESVGVVRFLMRIESPSNEIVRSIESAVDWFRTSRIDGIQQVKILKADTPKGYDTVIINKPNAEPLWARFYDLKTHQPFFCSRDGIPRKSLAEISYERRNGYSWYGQYASKLLEKDYPKWKQRIQEK